MPPRLRWTRLLLAGGAALGLASPGGPGAPASASVAQQAESTRRMAERLRSLASEYRTRVAPRPYFSANAPWRIPAYRARLAAAKDVSEAMNVRFELAQQLLWDGRNEEALAELEALASLKAEVEPAAARRMDEVLRPLWIAAYLRLGEQRNCLSRHGPTSCLFPIRPEGAHADRSGSQQALERLRRVLEDSPGDLAARWLLNLAHMTLGEYPEGVPRRWRIAPEAFQAEADLGQFPDVAIETRTDVVGLAGGVVLEDLDGDGLLDLVVSSWGLEDQLRFLRNQGDGSFSDRTEQAGLVGEVGGLNLSHADFDNDGDADLLVLRGGWLGPGGIFPPSLLLNNGDGTFEDVTERAGLLSAAHPGQTAAWADYDGDGDLDLFLGHETSSPDDPHPCQLFRNEGNGSFTDIAPRIGLAALGWVKGAAWGDYDNDGRPDLYVSRLGEANLLFRNEGPGDGAARPWRFRELAAQAGVREPRFSFPTWFWDYDNDGWLDIFVAAWDGSSLGPVAALYLGEPTRAELPRLYRNQRDGTFRDVTREARLDRVLLAMGANFGDLDNDGFEDAYIGTGAPDLWALLPNRMFRNDRGRVFQDVTSSGGFGHLQKGHGIAFGDIDGDGDQDVYAVMGGWFSGDVFANALFANPGHGHRWLTLRLSGVRSNRSAVGARLTLQTRGPDGERRIHRAVGTGGSFGSSSLQQEVGLGRADAIQRLEVRWPATGRVQVFQDVPLDCVVAIREDSDRFIVVPAPSFSMGRARTQDREPPQR